MSSANFLKVKSMEEHLDIAQLQLAMRYAPTRWLPSLKKIAADIEKSGDAVAAVDQHATGECRQSLKACLDYERPFELFSYVLRWRRQLNQSLRILLTTLLYPAALLFVTLVICTCLSSFMIKTMGDELLMFSDWGVSGVGGGGESIQVQLKEQSLRNQAVVWLILFFGATIAAIYLLLKPFERYALFFGLPGIGSMLRWNALAELLAVIGAIHERSPQIDRVLHSAQFLLGKDQVGRFAGVLQSFCQSGMSLKESISRLTLSDSMTDAIVGSMIDQQPAGFLQFEQAAKLIAHMSQRQSRFIAAVAPIVLLLMMGVMIASAVTGYFTFLIMLLRFLQALS